MEYLINNNTYVKSAHEAIVNARDVYENGIPVEMGFPWDSHANGNESHISMRTGIEMGIVSVGMGIAENVWFKKSHRQQILSSDESFNKFRLTYK